MKHKNAIVRDTYLICKWPNKRNEQLEPCCHTITEQLYPLCKLCNSHSYFSHSWQLNHISLSCKSQYMHINQCSLFMLQCKATQSLAQFTVEQAQHWHPWHHKISNCKWNSSVQWNILVLKCPLELGTSCYSIQPVAFPKLPQQTLTESGVFQPTPRFKTSHSHSFQLCHMVGNNWDPVSLNTWHTHCPSAWPLQVWELKITGFR